LALRFFRPFKRASLRASVEHSLRTTDENQWWPEAFLAEFAVVFG
jgi:hypothetical protein